jgi:hypothetical protein
VAKLQTKQDNNDLQIPTYVPIIFFLLDFSKSSFIFSQNSNFAARARDTDRNLFPICKNTAFKITFDKSTDNATQLDRVCIQEALQRNKHYYKVKNNFLDRKISLFRFGDYERNILQYTGGEHSILLAWKLRVYFSLTNSNQGQGP